MSNTRSPGSRTPGARPKALLHPGYRYRRGRIEPAAAEIPQPPSAHWTPTAHRKPPACQFPAPEAPADGNEDANDGDNGHEPGPGFEAEPAPAEAAPTVATDAKGRKLVNDAVAYIRGLGGLWQASSQ
jgi:hypothetical protein